VQAVAEEGFQLAHGLLLRRSLGAQTERLTRPGPEAFPLDRLDENQNPHGTSSGE
jgi:hypothetical protein